MQTTIAAYPKQNAGVSRILLKTCRSPPPQDGSTAELLSRLSRLSRHFKKHPNAPRHPRISRSHAVAQSDFRSTLSRNTAEKVGRSAECAVGVSSATIDTSPLFPISYLASSRGSGKAAH
jgi:hypothetical protein